jgi:acyl-CoA thioester hydrolase
MPEIRMTGLVPAEWIDLNQHMSSSTYLIAFRAASAEVFKQCGIDRAALSARSSSLFQREAHIVYARELRLGEPYSIRSWLVGIDQRSAMLIHEMSHRAAGWRSASIELVYTHVSTTERKSAPWPADVRQSLLSQVIRPPEDVIEGLGGQKLQLRPA